MEHQHYIFIANDISLIQDKKVSAVDIKDTLLKHGFWSFAEKAPLCAKLKEGDRVLIYLAGRGRKAFVANAIIANSAEQIAEGSKERDIINKLGIGFLKHKIILKNIDLFPNYVKILDVIDKLNFIIEKKNYGLHLRLPIVRVNQEDFELILKCSNVSRIAK